MATFPAGAQSSTGVETSTVPTAGLTVDQNGNGIFLDAMPHVYGYNGSGQIITDTVTDGTNIWIKTFTYTNSLLTGESQWVKQ